MLCWITFSKQKKIKLNQKKMTEEETYYIDIGQNIKSAEQSQMFAKPCFKLNDKAFASFFENEMVFKLPPETQKEAMACSGSKLFDPSGKGHAMKEWVQVPFIHKS